MENIELIKNDNVSVSVRDVMEDFRIGIPAIKLKLRFDLDSPSLYGG